MGDSAKRGLTLIAKTLQNLANGVTFGKKESFMEPMNEFIETHTDECFQYFEQVSIPKATRHTRQLNNAKLTIPEKRSHLESLLEMISKEWVIFEQKTESKEWFPDLKNAVQSYKQKYRNSTSLE